ncbi:MAG: family 2A encapsulin nanocompartment shell protein [Actinomycetes bacterium]
MATAKNNPGVLGEAAARKLATTTKTVPQWEGITPRWLVNLLPWQPVEAGVYRLNKVVDAESTSVDVECTSDENEVLPKSYINYQSEPREYVLNAVTTTVEIQTRISDLFRSPHDQVREQLRISIEKVKERQEDQLINNAEYGLLNQAVASQRLKPRTGAPTPDDMDELIVKVWKQPSFFLAHPRTIAAFGRECTRRGVPPAAVNLFGVQFLTWRGIPIVPTDKLAVDSTNHSNIILLRTGAEKQGVVGLFQPGLPGEVNPSLSVRFMGINQQAQASYLISLYCSAAVHTDDAIAVLEGVEVSNYHDYA